MLPVLLCTEASQQTVEKGQLRRFGRCGLMSANSPKRPYGLPANAVCMIASFIIASSSPTQHVFRPALLPIGLRCKNRRSGQCRYINRPPQARAARSLS